ncbi:MAG: replication and repair protein RecF protein [Candidatus Levybacteria bacterium GW2011_GWB1_35_5]|nr:MAG: replication and repair protein RecF protein [Candidatus Levybacteria bacterium GW2011_GWB1_35_5]
MLKSIHLQNFRSYKKADFNFSDKSTLVVGPNTIGKSNLLEAIFLISIGKSFRTDKDFQMLSLGKEVGRVSALVDDLRLEVVVTNGDVGGVKTQYKKFLVNGVAKKRVDFAGNLLSVLFSPSDLDIIVDSPSLRRNFLDNVLEQVDRNYRIASIAFSKALRQRNALLELVKDTGFKNEKQFEYWDNLVIQNGQIITQKRQEIIDFVNNTQKDIFEFIISYDKSTISRDRLNQYKVEEQAAGVTLVGPHRDDFSVLMKIKKDTNDVKYFGSRGQQRLAILQLKALEILFIEKIMGKRPLLLLDDIFSELDSVHINLVLDQVGKQQTIITTTHKEFVAKSFLKNMEVIELENGKKNFLV